MQILFDHQTFSLQAYGGISRYYAELLSGINNQIDTSADLPILFSNNIYLREKGFPIYSFFPGIGFYKKEQLLYRLNQEYSKKKISKSSYDVFHATYYDPYFIPYLNSRPFVITFLDMIHEKFASQFHELAADNMITQQKQFMADRADRIIAISESTKRDVVELLNINPDKIDVIYLGSSLKLSFTNASEKLKEGNEPYLLFVGNRGHYKNFQGLLQAIHPLLKKYKLKIICGGGGPLIKTELLLINSLGISDLVEHTPVNDQSLQVLYQQAVAFIFPSLYEGFGIPILEAFACNCPCIISNRSSLPEVADDAALYIDPLLPDSIANAVEKLILDQTLRQTLIQRGKKRLAQFSWERTVTETINVYKAVS